tara:strand:+ start:3556 stop:3708 length:153 start_codon:yes stop_codon:yes gene_type:complete
MTQAEKQFSEKVAQKWFRTSYNNLTPFGKEEVDNETACTFEHLNTKIARI